MTLSILQILDGRPKSQYTNEQFLMQTSLPVTVITNKR